MQYMMGPIRFKGLSASKVVPKLQSNAKPFDHIVLSNDLLAHDFEVPNL